MKRALILFAMALSVNAADVGKATGKFMADAKTTRTLTHAYAVERLEMVKVVLASGAVEEAELFSDDALQAAVGARNLSALVIELDEGNPTFFFDQKLPAGLEVRTVTKFTPEETADGSVAGRMTMKDPDFSFSFDATFHAALIVQPPGEEPPAEEIPETPEALRDAVDRGNADVVKHLLERGVDKNGKDAYGQSLIMTAVSNHHTDVVKLLIEAGADVNAANQWRITPLAVAAERGHLDLVNLLVAAGAKVNARDTAGSTALSVAILRGYTEIVAALIEAGTDVQRDKEDLLALAADKPEIKAMLEKAMAKKK